MIKTKKTLIIVAGIFFIILGLLGLVLPILQGILFLIIGFLILSISFPKVRLFITKFTNKYPQLLKTIDKAEKLLTKFIGKV